MVQFCSCFLHLNLTFSYIDAVIKGCIFTNQLIFRFAYASFGDESKAECTIFKETSVLLYPTTLQTKFVPAFFTQGNNLGQEIGGDWRQSKRQVSSSLSYCKLAYHSNEVR